MTTQRLDVNPRVEKNIDNKCKGIDKLEFCEVTAEKFNEIWPMYQEILRAGETMASPMDSNFEQGRAAWFAPKARVFYAYLNGICVASRYIAPNKPGLGSHVANMGVMIDRKFRGRGFGRQMMAFGIKKARELGYRAIQLNLVVSTNTASIKICKEFGFEIIGELPEAFHWRGERYVDAFVMFKTL